MGGRPGLSSLWGSIKNVLSRRRSYRESTSRRWKSIWKRRRCWKCLLGKKRQCHLWNFQKHGFPREKTIEEPRPQEATQVQGTPSPLAHSPQDGENVDWKPATIAYSSPSLPNEDKSLLLLLLNTRPWKIMELHLHLCKRKKSKMR